MSTPAFDPQPCCGTDGGATEVTVTNVPLDVNVTNVIDVGQPVDVNVVNTVAIAEPVDVIVQGTVSASLGGSTAAVNTLTAVVSGTGATVDFSNAKSNVTMMVRVNGTATGGVVAFQGSQDGTNWVTIASSAQFATGVNQYVSLTGGAFRWFRGLITENVAGGGNVTVSLMFA